MNKNEQEKQEAITTLTKDFGLKPGTMVYSVVRSVSKSGMSRRIDFYMVVNGRIQWITRFVAVILGYAYNPDKHGISVSGCGMDMCFATVYNLGSAIWPKGTDKAHGMRNGEPDSTGGYALKSEILA